MSPIPITPSPLLDFYLPSRPFPTYPSRRDSLGNRNLFYSGAPAGNNDGARIYASNAICKKSESLNLLRLASRIETAMSMRQVTGNMTSVIKDTDKAMEAMNLERVRRSHPPPLPHSFSIHLTSLIFPPVRPTHLWFSINQIVDVSRS